MPRRSAGGGDPELNIAMINSHGSGQDRTDLALFFGCWAGFGDCSWRVLGADFGGRGTDPGWSEAQDPRLHRAIALVRARQIADAHQELADDLAAGEAERVAEELDPLLLRQRMVRIEPGGKRAVALAQREERRAFSIVASILRRLRMMPGSARRRAHVARAELGDAIEIPIGEGRGEGRALLSAR